MRYLLESLCMLFDFEAKLFKGVRADFVTIPPEFPAALLTHAVARLLLLRCVGRKNVIATRRPCFLFEILFLSTAQGRALLVFNFRDGGHSPLERSSNKGYAKLPG